MTNPFAGIQFTGRLRPSQQDAVEIARRQLAAGERHLHIVAPPGSGKTILGLYLWAECIRRPALVLSPNSAIQAQWAARTELFGIDGSRDPLISTDPQSLGLLAKNKRSVEVYQRYWNTHVSPGVALYAYQGEGSRLLEQARRDHLVPGSEIREKEVFL